MLICPFFDMLCYVILSQAYVQVMPLKVKCLSFCWFSVAHTCVVKGVLVEMFCVHVQFP